MPIQGRNFCIIDTETTGVNLDTCEVIHLCGKVLNYANLDDHHAGEIELLIKPEHPELAEEGALKVIGPLWDKALKEGIEAKVAYQAFYDWLIRTNDLKSVWGLPFAYAHNAKFDFPLIKRDMLKYGIVKRNKKGFLDFPWFSEFDTIQTQHACFETHPDCNDLKLDTFLALGGIARSSEHHSAMEDVRLLTQMLKRCIQWQRKCQGLMRKNLNKSNEETR